MGPLRAIGFSLMASVGFAAVVYVAARLLGGSHIECCVVRTPTHELEQRVLGRYSTDPVDGYRKSLDVMEDHRYQLVRAAESSKRSEMVVERGGWKVEAGALIFQPDGGLERRPGVRFVEGLFGGRFVLDVEGWMFWEPEPLCPGY